MEATLIERKRREAVEELVATAIELFDRDGFEATTVEAIAATAGCSPRTFYRYFGSKEDVLFHDVPDLIARLAAVLEGHLDRGLAPWTALSQAVVEILGRLDAAEEDVPVLRMELWLREPALRARYMQHLGMAESTIVETLSRHRHAGPERDDLAHLMAIGAIGAYRTTVTTHGAAGSSRRLTAHLESLLADLGRGFDEAGQRA